MNFLLSLIDKISREKQIMKLTMKCTPSTHTLKHLSTIIMVIPTKLPDPTVKEILPTSTFYYMFRIIGCPHNVENSIPLTNGFIWAIFASQWITLLSKVNPWPVKTFLGVVIVMDIVHKKYLLPIDCIRVFWCIHLKHVCINILDEKKTCNGGIQIALHKIYHA